jgi:hypothetical protein
MQSVPAHLGIKRRGRRVKRSIRFGSERDVTAATHASR